MLKRKTSSECGFLLWYLCKEWKINTAQKRRISLRELKTERKSVLRKFMRCNINSDVHTCHIWLQRLQSRFRNLRFLEDHIKFSVNTERGRKGCEYKRTCLAIFRPELRLSRKRNVHPVSSGNVL
jgi:hypothetical protein